MTATPYNGWDGAYEDGTIPRPGFAYPWAYVLQADDGGVAWGVYSQAQLVTPRWRGHAADVDAARAAAIAATEEGT